MYLQQKQRYQAGENLLMCENNHIRPNLAGIIGSVVRWGYPKRIGNNNVKSYCYGCLNAPSLQDNIMYFLWIKFPLECYVYR